MAFDAGMLACVVSELKQSAIGGRVERIHQPGRDEIVIQLRTPSGVRRLLINAGSHSPRIGYTLLSKENPATPPNFCMLLRKHLGSARLKEVVQQGFERAVWLGFECRDELGFDSRKYLIVEVMGKYSNLILTDASLKIINALRPVDFTTSSRRQVLPGMKYELPPPQDKADPMVTSREEFFAAVAAASGEQKAERFIADTYMGISATVAREIVFRANRSIDTPLTACDPDRLWQGFSEIIESIRAERFNPTLINLGGKPVEYSYVDLTHYGAGAERRHFESAGELLDAFYGERDRRFRIKQQAADILRILKAAESRISRKLERQRAELAECARGEDFRRNADLITANIHAIKKGDEVALLTDYSDMREDGSFGMRKIKLDPQLSPAENAQRLYKKYNKLKHGKVELTRQIALGEAELEYIASVLDSLERAETSDDLAGIRDELIKSGYIAKNKNNTPQKKQESGIMTFRTDGGFIVLCGRNNLQNEHLTHRLASKDDFWFHVKERPGSHVVLVTNGREPGEVDFTQAARIAALYSSARDGQNVPVDYTPVKNLKKTPGSRPGFVIYHTNWTAYVTPDPGEAERLRVKTE